jgi:hypothetical protein
MAKTEQNYPLAWPVEDFSGGTIPWRRVLGFKDGELVNLDAVNQRLSAAIPISLVAMEFRRRSSTSRSSRPEKS